MYSQGTLEEQNMGQELPSADFHWAKSHFPVKVQYLEFLSPITSFSISH